MQNLIEEWITILKRYKHFNQDMLDKIMLRHKMKPTIELLCELSNYSDRLAYMWEDDFTNYLHETYNI